MFWDGDRPELRSQIAGSELEIRHERKEDYGWMDGWMDGTSIQPSVIKQICYCSLLPVPLRVLGKPLIFWLSRQGCGLLSDVRAAWIFVYLWFKRHQDATLDITHRPVSGKLQVHLPTQKHPCSQSKTKRQHEQGQCCTRPIRSEKGMSKQDTPHLKKKKKDSADACKVFDDLCFDIVRMTRPLRLQPAF